jgi:hypothetical protein
MQQLMIPLVYLVLRVLKKLKVSLVFLVTDYSMQ